jgi:hypothetical protein
MRPGGMISRAFALMMSILREIFDENAYARFLERNAVPNSRESYRAFVRENSLRRERRARCC